MRTPQYQQPAFQFKYTPKQLHNRFDKWVEEQSQVMLDSYVRTTSQKRQGADGKVMLQKLENKNSVPTPLLIEDFLEHIKVYFTWDVCVNGLRQRGGYDQVIAHIQNVIKGHNRRGALLGYYKL